MKRVVWLVMVLGLTSAFGCGQAQGSKQTEGVRNVAPNFELTDLEGSPLSLSALQGKVVLLDFWATWCPPCVQEIPHFVELYGQYQDQGLEIVGISLDQGGPEVVRSFLKTHNVTYPIAMGDAQLTQAYGGIRGIPTTFLIDKKGRIAHKYVGYHSKEVFETQIQKLLAE